MVDHINTVFPQILVFKNRVSPKNKKLYASIWFLNKKEIVK